MTDIANFFGKADAAVRALEISTEPGVHFKSSATKGSLWNDGFVSTLTLWSDGLVKVGLLASPDMAPADWRGVIATDGEMLTLSRDARQLVPRYLMSRFVSDNADGLKKLSTKWQALLPLLGGLHEALGGVPGTLAAISEIVADPSRHTAFSADDDALQFERAMSALARQIDDSAAFTTFADWLDDAVQGDRKPPLKLQKLAPWDRLCLCWTFKSGEEISLDDPLVRDVIEMLPGLDAGPPASFTWNIWPGMTSSQATIVRMAEQVSEAGPDSDEPYGRIVAAIAEQGVDYDGLAHAEATTQYAEADDATRALGTLTAAAWWMSRRQGQPPPAVHDGIHMLCAANGWDDLLWVADHEREMAR